MIHRTCVVVVAVACWLAAASSAPAQQPESAVVAEVAAGWAALAAGDPGRASTIASVAAGRYPGNAAIGALLVQAEASRVGSQAALTAYESWLGARATEAPYVLRLVAVSFLREIVLSAPGGGFQRLAIQGLQDNGEPVAAIIEAIDSGAGSDASAEARAMLGDQQAVQILIDRLENTPGNRIGPIEALAAAGSMAAVGPLIGVLNDPFPFTQMAAARALGQLKAPQAVAPLRALLTNEPQFSVRFAAAQALFELKDPAGRAFFGTVDRSAPMLQTQVLEATASEPTPAWVASVRQSLQNDDPQVKLLAAKLLAPHDPEAADAALRGLLENSNIAVAEAASTLYTEAITDDFSALRQLLRHPNGITRAKAAIRVLELTTR